MKLKKADDSGMTARKIIVVPCIVNSVLYCCAVRTLLFGTISWVRMSSASKPPIRKKMRAKNP